jgi:hypothetical protein
MNVARIGVIAGGPVGVGPCRAQPFKWWQDER